MSYCGLCLGCITDGVITQPGSLQEATGGRAPSESEFPPPEHSQRLLTNVVEKQLLSVKFTGLYDSVHLN